MEHLELTYDTPMGELPASMRAAWEQIHSAVALHREAIGPDLAPVENWDPRPALDSDLETRQVAALWGRIAMTIKRARVAVRSRLHPLVRLRRGDERAWVEGRLD